MDFKGFFTKSEIESKTIKDGDCFGLKEDAIIGGLNIDKGNIIMYSSGKWMNLSSGSDRDCCKILNDIEAGCTVGYIEKGDIIEEGTTFTEVFDNMFRRDNA